MQTPCSYCAARRKGLCLGINDSDADGIAALESARSAIRLYDPGEIIYEQGDASEHVFNLVSGWVALHRDIADGRRQITRFLLPGAVFGAEPAGEELGHTATAITNAIVCPIAIAKLYELRRRIPSLNEQFILVLEHDSQNAIKALTSLGQGTAKERIGFLLRDLAVTAVGEDRVNAGAAVIKMPLTQRHIAQATGLTSIHVNRVLRQLREDQVIELHDGVLSIIDPRKLRRVAEPTASWRWAAPERGWGA